MFLADKIDGLIKERGLNFTEFHRKLKELFKRKSVSYQTLFRSVKGKTKMRVSTLFQIACGLGMTPSALKKDTEQEEKFIRHIYHKDAYFEETVDKLPFLAGWLVLKPKAKTANEQSPIKNTPSIKWLYGTQGQTTCFIETKNGLREQVIKYGDSFNFDSTQPHHFENRTKRKSVCVVVQFPPYPLEDSPFLFLEALSKDGL